MRLVKQAYGIPTLGTTLFVTLCVFHLATARDLQYARTPTTCQGTKPSLNAIYEAKADPTSSLRWLLRLFPWPRYSNECARLTPSHPLLVKHLLFVALGFVKRCTEFHSRLPSVRKAQGNIGQKKAAFEAALEWKQLRDAFVSLREEFI